MGDFMRTDLTELGQFDVVLYLGKLVPYGGALNPQCGGSLA